MKKIFELKKQSKDSSARTGVLRTAHGKILTPFFMPVATRAAVKHLTTDELLALGSQIVLSNTYHLLLRPGMPLMEKYGGLHSFMNWKGPILTDSGGYQVFSLSKHRKITKQGARFRDPLNGKEYFISPEKAVRIQNTIGADIMMAFDECPPYPCARKYALESLEITNTWAKRCLREFARIKNSDKSAKKRLLFGIVQGSVYEDLRGMSARALTEMDFDGFAIGGVAVGEPREKMKDVLGWTLPFLPESKPRYLMGLGRPEEIVHAVKSGIDMFDCVIPTREARHGRLYVPTQKRLLLKGEVRYKVMNIANAKFARDLAPINTTNLQQYSKAYLHHLFKTNEALGMRFATLNNLEFYHRLMSELRESIERSNI